MNIGEKIRTYRRNCKLTQKELGEKIGVSDKTISSWENSRTMPDLEMLSLLHHTLGLPIDFPSIESATGMATVFLTNFIRCRTSFRMLFRLSL
ncbi:helix-turn-helix domain-containing protein, partial [Enterococcus faecium]|uniref:helix-turn-helix domain-containing protein n=1 Tax=Enterococcus faecium TaxID=1352 RepID=UPI00338EBBC5